MTWSVSFLDNLSCGSHVVRDDLRPEPTPGWFWFYVVSLSTAPWHGIILRCLQGHGVARSYMVGLVDVVP